MSQAYLLLGSNKGNKLAIIRIAAEKLQELSESHIQLSSVFESEPWGFETEEWFLNQAIKIETKLSPSELLKAVLDIELIMGRVRPQEYQHKVEDNQLDKEQRNSVKEQNYSVEEKGKTYTSRTLDIDILLYDNLIIDTADLIVPHPKLHLRMFALKPLCEIAPLEIHPVLDKSIRELIEECEDTLIVRKIKN